GLAFGLYMLSAGLATVLVWCTSDLVLGMFSSDDPTRWRWLFRLPLVALGLAGLLFYVLVRDRPEDVGLQPVDDAAAAAAAGEPTAAETTSWHERYRAV